MLVDRKIKNKLNEAAERYRALIYETVCEIPMQIAQTKQHFRTVPTTADGVEWSEAKPGTNWGGQWMNAWFEGTAVLPEACDDKEVFVCAKTGGVETLLFVNGVASGLLNSYAVGDANPPHHTAKRAVGKAKAGAQLHIALEVYAGHPCVGTSPHDGDLAAALEESKFVHKFEKVELVLRRYDVNDFYMDMRTLLSLANALDSNSLRYAKVMVALQNVYKLIYQIPNEVSESEWRPALAEAREIMHPLLQAHNGDTAPFFGLTGHSHLDTAWLWTIDETVRKAARTFSTALNMMEQYPEYRFLQSAPCHADMIRQHYPEIFERIKQAVKAGKWEPNGGMWIEPDCNLTSGESMVRQFLYGQMFTQKEFGFRSDTYWQPDVFGYSAAIPQIMRGCGVKYFLTTKLGWNDTNRFPYDTFRWKGIDGSEVIASFNDIHVWPEPKSLADQWAKVQHKDVQDRRFSAYGYGDGGGGPQNEMIELARRVTDLEGCPRARHMSVSEFMHGLEEATGNDLPTWVGELYLELHRGTLTSIHGIKRGNRKSELALRDAEWAWSLAQALGSDYPKQQIDDLWKILLINQFHDILPGSSITEVNQRAIKELEECRRSAMELSIDGLKSICREKSDSMVIANSLGWAREGEFTIDAAPEGLAPCGNGITIQAYSDVQARGKMAVTGVKLPPLGVTSVCTAKPGEAGASPFVITECGVETPFAVVRFDERGRIVSFYDKSERRELVRAGGVFNAFRCGEDIPADWDNWDIDYDYKLKQRDSSKLISREILSNGSLQLRIRSKYAVGSESTITQDMVFHSTTPRIDFETLADWKETHKLLKAGFDTAISAEYARHDIQFGHLMRATHSNLSTDRARFEVCNHKWTDLSESSYGIAILNDCKYGINVLDGSIGLTLLRSGTHPDFTGDNGVHRFDYAILPHPSAFGVESVVRPAYEFNIPVTAIPMSTAPETSLASVSAPNIIVEAVKRSEDGNSLVIRLYEAGNSRTRCRMKFGLAAKKVSAADMLEEAEDVIAVEENSVELEFRPFEIKTLLIELESK